MSQELCDKEISIAFDKLKITPEVESSIKEKSNNLDNGNKTMILDSIYKLLGIKKHPYIDFFFFFFFDFLSKTVATNFDKDTLTDSTSQLITEKVLVNQNTSNGLFVSK